ncbi:tRNA pseudouridine(38-40) synthase TruA [Henriciella algicola]|uniref:tRNA pseudouridine synthase A n=1 Tax=Henriciella algicola TaxID=1608422 RepID=A0A399RC18_9PROT|nr:tRNA pseudouridine(38-40) synthase TruA [Henriciella algicola]RIJ27577.1 tRNA pseudouridine(38-40) synthase TruA [Henriciella algicola]
MSQRLRLLVEYDGRPYYGWQRQDGQPTVQGALERAAAKLDGQPVVVQGAGRTDAGVHATGQVAHVTLQKPRPVRKLCDALNYHLRPDPVAVLAVEEVDESFHARFDATGRAYRYIIQTRRAHLTFDKGLIWRIPFEIDVHAMQEAANHLIGEHDFSTFRDAACQAKSPVKTLDTLEVFRLADRVEITTTARSFLHRQVRSITGSLVEVGRGMREPAWMKEILEARDRTACGPVAPADGLYLERVMYGDQD